MKIRNRIYIWIMSIFMILSAALPTAVLYYRGYSESPLWCIPPVLFAGMVVLSLVQFRQYRVRYVAKLTSDCSSTEAAALEQLPMGMCVLDDEGNLIHYNGFFARNILHGSDQFGKELREKIPLTPDLPEQQVVWQQRVYKVTSYPYREDDIMMTAYLWQDVSDYEILRRQFEETRPSVLLIMVDNYEDIIRNAKESTKLEVSVAVEKLMESFVAGTNGVLRRTSTDRFLAVLEEQHIQRIMEGKFRLLDDARAIRVDEKNRVTLSIGVGHGASSLQESEQIAAQCLDMAIGRGGDQAVVRTENGYRFFGGVSKGVEKKSRAKTRMVAGALQELICGSENVLIMGHRFGDLDSVGSACGLAGAVQMMGVPVHVVVDPVKNLSRQLLDMMQDEIGGGLFLDPEEALEEITPKSLLIIVDTHNKDILESERLYREAERVVVIDHHRKTVNYVDNALIFHHEPYASSACEMVTELIQYFKLNAGEMDACYGDCLLAGITLDTKNFVMRTGVRTFEAAAFLRKMGADTVKVKGLFAGSIDNYRSRAKIVGSAQIEGKYAVAAADPDMEDVRLAAPQAADELLSIQGVDAAFVIYEIHHVVNISARSLGAVNVQVIMEMLGGGGHQSMAATQLPDCTVEEAKRQLMAAIAEVDP